MTPPRNINPRGPSQRYPNTSEPITNDPKGVDQGHQNSDLDSSKFSQHHTLGPNPNQSSPGNHIHDGSNSKLTPANSILDLVGGFTTYVPTWVAVTTNPTIGNGVLTGKFLQLGKLVLFSFEATFGSTTTAGTGLYSFALPVQAITGGASQVSCCFGTIQAAGSAGRRPCTGFLDTGGLNVSRITHDSAGSTGLASTTFAWASGDFITMSGFYEANVSA